MKPLSIRVSDEVHSALVAQAEREGGVVSELIRRAAQVAAQGGQGQGAGPGLSLAELAAAEERIMAALAAMEERLAARLAAAVAALPAAVAGEVLRAVQAAQAKQGGQHRAPTA